MGGPRWPGTHCVYLACLRLATLHAGSMGISHITQKQVAFKGSFLFFIDVYVVVSVYVCGHLRRPEELVGSPETAVTEGCGPTEGVYWEPSLRPQQEQGVLLNQ